MNTKVLTKCLEELSKETPNIEKVIGMLETIIEMSNSQPIISPLQYQTQPSYPYSGLTAISGGAPSGATGVSIPVEDEGSGILAAYAGGSVAQL